MMEQDLPDFKGPAVTLQELVDWQNGKKRLPLELPTGEVRELTRDELKSWEALRHAP